MRARLVQQFTRTFTLELLFPSESEFSVRFRDMMLMLLPAGVMAPLLLLNLRIRSASIPKSEPEEQMFVRGRGRRRARGGCVEFFSALVLYKVPLSEIMLTFLNYTWSK